MANINNVFVLKEIIAMLCGGLQLMVMRCSWIHATPMAMSLSDKMNMVNCGKKNFNTCGVICDYFNIFTLEPLFSIETNRMNNKIWYVLTSWVYMG